MLPAIPAVIGKVLTGVVGVVFAVVTISRTDTRETILVGVLVGIVNTMFLLYLTRRNTTREAHMAMLAEKDKEIDRLSRRCDRLVDVLDRSGINVRASDREDPRDG